MVKRDLGKTAVKAGIGYTIGNILLKGCTFLTLPIFARILSTSDYGVYTTYLAYELILTSIIGLGIYGGVKNAKLKYSLDFEKYISVVLCFVCLLAIACAIIIVPVLPFIREKTALTNILIYTLLLHSLGDAVIQIYACKLNIQFKYKAYLGLSSFNTLFNIGISILLIEWIFPNQRYLGRIFGTAFPVILVSIIIMISSVLKGKCLFNKDYIRYALTLGLPLVPHVLSQSILSQFDRIMITDFIGSSEAGIYSFIYTISTVLLVISNSLDSAWTPWMYMMRKENRDDEIDMPSRKYILFFSLLTMGFICVAPEVIKVFGTTEYYDGINLIVPLSLANYFMFLYFLPVNLEYYSNKTFYISIGTIGAGIVNFVLNFIFIPVFGYRAAAYTTLLSYAFLFVLHCLIAKKFKFFEIYNFKYLFKSICLMVIISFTLLFVSQSIIGIAIRYVIAALIVLYIMLNVKNFLNLKSEKGN